MLDGLGIGPFGEGVGLVDPDEEGKSVVFCIPSYTKPTQACIDSIEASAPLLDEAGFKHSLVFEFGCPYISAARMKMLRKALDTNPDMVVFIDDDLSWAPPDLAKLVSTKGPVIAGTYRFKKDEEEYMGLLDSDRETHKPQVREDGCIKADLVPAGFLKVTKQAIDRFMRRHPNLCFGPAYNMTVDLFHHGVEDGRWFSEDYAFSRHWRQTGGDIWIIPNLQLDHHYRDEKETACPGNFHEFLLKCPGGSKHVHEWVQVSVA